MYLNKAKEYDLETFYTMSLQKHIGENLNFKSLTQFQNEFKDEATIFLCAMHEESIAGYIILAEEAEAVQLKRIVIDEKHLGVGAEVMLLVEEYCLMRLGKDSIWLDVYADNARAVHLYEKLGYVRYNEGIENHRKVWFYRKTIGKKCFKK
jgi:ribosomal protein S18 acetylase RimI-like enzyme